MKLETARGLLGRSIASKAHAHWTVRERTQELAMMRASLLERNAKSIVLPDLAIANARLVQPAMNRASALTFSDFAYPRAIAPRPRTRYAGQRVMH